MTRNWRVPALIVAAVVFASRAPFLGNGYGVDSDAWRLAHAAAVISTTGEWQSSRPPGHPIQEFVCSLLWGRGAFVLNGATAVLCAVAALLVVACSKRLGDHRPWLTGIAFAFTPAIVLHSTSSMDYIWALTFLLAAFHAALGGRAIWTGVWLGVAVGCRANSVVLLPAILLALVAVSPRSAGPGRVLTTVTFGGVLGAACYIPVAMTYGVDYLSGVFVHGYPWWGFVVQYATVDVWGLVGTLALMVTVVSATIRFLVRRAERTTSETAMSFACLLATVSGLALYLALPYESGYLVVVVPFLLMFLGLHAGPAAFASLAVALTFCNLLDIGTEGVRPGIIVKDRSTRIAQAARVREIIDDVRQLGGSPVVVAGPWQYKIMTTEFGDPSPDVHWVFIMDRRLLDGPYVNSTIYYLPEIRVWNRTHFGLDLAETEATALVTRL